MKLDEFINQVGASKIAKALGTSESNIYQWKRYDVAPRPVSAYQLILMSHNALNWESIYKPFVEKHYKKRKVSFKNDQIKFL